MNPATPLFIARADKKSLAKNLRIASATVNTVRLRSALSREQSNGDVTAFQIDAASC